MELWHGSPVIVKHPRLELCRPNNDYGAGFYCTQEVTLAKEWACSSPEGGFANHYELDSAGLSMLELNSPEYTVLNWLAVLVANRTFQAPTPLATSALRHLAEHYLPDTSSFDLISGWRADDSYFSFARAFVSNQISVEQLSRAMRLGKLGIQIVVMSPRAFSRIHYLGHERADVAVYGHLREERDAEARSDYKRMAAEFDANGIYMADILRGAGDALGRLR